MNILRFIICWAWVSLPLGWGLYRSVLNAMPLFTAHESPSAAPVAPAAPVTPEAPAAK